MLKTGLGNILKGEYNLNKYWKKYYKIIGPGIRCANE